MKTLLLLTLLLTACAGGQAYPDSPKYRQCQYDAIKATRGQQFYGARGIIAEAYAEALVKRDIIDACMRTY
jgi:hypothetical protein